MDTQESRCRNLVAAVVIKAIEDHIDKLKELGQSAIRREPGRWLTSKEDHPYSFVWCCEVLDLHPDRIVGLLDDPEMISKAREVVKKAEKARKAETALR